MAVIITGYLDGIRSLKDKSLKLSFTTQEVNNEKAADIFSLNVKYIKLMMSDKNVDQRIDKIEKEIDNLVIDSNDKKKSPSKRLRNALHVLWEKSHNEYGDFELFYQNRMEKLIQQIKDRIKTFEI